MIFDGVELPSLLPIERAASVLRVDVAVVHDWIAEGKLESVRVNGRVRVLTTSIEHRMGLRTLSRSNRESQT